MGVTFRRVAVLTAMVAVVSTGRPDLARAQVDDLLCSVLEVGCPGPRSPGGASAGRLAMTWCIAVAGSFPPREGSSPSNDTYLGQLMLFATDFCPAGFAPCDGQLLAITQNQALYSLLGTNFGGDGQSTFGLPDLRCRAPMHQGTCTDGSSVAVGEECGAATCE